MGHRGKNFSFHFKHYNLIINAVNFCKTFCTCSSNSLGQDPIVESAKNWKKFICASWARNGKFGVFFEKNGLGPIEVNMLILKIEVIFLVYKKIMINTKKLKIVINVVCYGNVLYSRSQLQLLIIMVCIQTLFLQYNLELLPKMPLLVDIHGIICCAACFSSIIFVFSQTYDQPSINLCSWLFGVGKRFQYSM
jgi:hypothetical protein